MICVCMYVRTYVGTYVSVTPYAAGRRRAIAGRRRQMEAEEDGAGPSAMVVEEDGVEPSAIAIRCGECHMRTRTSQDGAGPSALVIPRGECHQRTPLVVDIGGRERGQRWMDAGEDGAGPSAMVVESDRVGPSAMVVESDRVGPSAMVVESEGVEPSATVTEVGDMMVLESKSERSQRLATLRKRKQRNTFIAEVNISRSEQNKLKKKKSRCGESLQKK